MLAPRGGFVGLTPQGLARSWRRLGDTIRTVALDDAWSALATRADALVISELERSSCAELVRTAGAAGAIVLVTDGHRPATLSIGDGAPTALTVPALAQAVRGPRRGRRVRGGAVRRAGRRRRRRACRALREAAAAVRMAGSGAAAIGDRAAITARAAIAARPQA